jgi:hypothetical protein
MRTHRGFWARLRPGAIASGWPTGYADLEFDKGGNDPGVTTPRDWLADARAYLKFIKDYKDSLMYGSDQVALNYGSNIQVNVETASLNKLVPLGKSFVNRNPSTQVRRGLGGGEGGKGANGATGAWCGACSVCLPSMCPCRGRMGRHC